MDTSSVAAIAVIVVSAALAAVDLGRALDGTPGRVSAWGRPRFAAPQMRLYRRSCGFNGGAIGVSTAITSQLGWPIEVAVVGAIGIVFSWLLLQHNRSVLTAFTPVDHVLPAP